MKQTRWKLTKEEQLNLARDSILKFAVPNALIVHVRHRNHFEIIGDFEESSQCGDGEPDAHEHHDREEDPCVRG